MTCLSIYGCDPAFDCNGTCPLVDVVARYAERLQRPMTDVETACIAEGERIAMRQDALHAMWLARRDAKLGEVVVWGGE